MLTAPYSSIKASLSLDPSVKLLHPERGQRLSPARARVTRALALGRGSGPRGHRERNPRTVVTRVRRVSLSRERRLHGEGGKGVGGGIRSGHAECRTAVLPLAAEAAVRVGDAALTAN